MIKLLQESQSLLWCLAVTCFADTAFNSQVSEIARDTHTIRSLDHDRDRFDIEFGYGSDFAVPQARVNIRRHDHPGQSC